MTPEQFCYWLQGFFEISGAEKIDARQTKEIKNHLSTVFEKVTPDVSIPFIQPQTYPTPNPWPGTGPWDTICSMQTTKTGKHPDDNKLCGLQDEVL
jgi:hypothetical protein